MRARCSKESELGVLRADLLMPQIFRLLMNCGLTNGEGQQVQYEETRMVNGHPVLVTGTTFVSSRQTPAVEGQKPARRCTDDELREMVLKKNFPTPKATMLEEPEAEEIDE
ncbi:MAG: uncharacterized protein KVP18_004953 [Porospora cf. gigantea A]|uniref:uncharacterized protein n=1 Tax=Porospora cf. gigantea A TaxID=2853593 RepID=UPI00355A9419|nr:MAG: hypothetical protein KVP18_004953 [Porospora cf. gigantea A]